MACSQRLTVQGVGESLHQMNNQLSEQLIRQDKPGAREVSSVVLEAAFVNQTVVRCARFQ
jgi:hypothetical protein